MPLPQEIEFLAAQRSKSGQHLTRMVVFQIISTIPPSRTVQFTVTPGASSYANYAFRLVIDPIVVPGAFRVEIAQYGFNPFTGVLHAGSLGSQIDYFLRITQGNPSLNTVINQTALNQQIILYLQSLQVANEDDYRELEERMIEFQRGTLAVRPIIGTIKSTANPDVVAATLEVT